MNIVDRETASLAAGDSVTVFANRQITRSPFSGYLEIGLGGGSGLKASIVVGGGSAANNMPMQVLTAFPVLPSELEFQDNETIAGTPVEIVITNPTAGALSYWAYARLSTSKRGN